MIRSQELNSRRRRQHHLNPLRLEILEDRRLLAVVTVDTDHDVIDFNDGRTSLREAIFAANTVPGPDEIVFDFGHANPVTILLQQGEMEITEALSIAGDGPELLTVDAQQQSRIFNITATPGDFTLAGMTLTGGSTTGDGNTYGGGAVRSATNGMLTIDDCDIRGNSTAGSHAHGGGVYAAGNLAITSSHISDNQASGSSGDGGGISAGAVTVDNSIITDNFARGTGGGISGGWVTVVSSTISGNRSHRVFGAITGHAVTVVSSTLSDNGGGISAGTVTVDSCIVSGNQRGIDGDTVTVSASTIVDHGASGVEGENVTVDSSTFVGNAAAVTGDNVQIAFSTLARNLAGRGGSVSGETVTILNSIVAGLQAGAGALDVQYSLIGDNTGTDLTEAPVGSPDARGNLIGGPINGFIDPKLGPLVNNGGPTVTHAVLPDSPAIDAGDHDFLPPPEFDQRGMPYNRVAGGRIDMGAYERQDLTVEIVDVASPTIVATDEVTIEFTSPVTGFDVGDLELWRNSAWIALSGSETLHTNDNQVFSLSGLADATAASGYYTLKLLAPDSGILDADGDPLDSSDSVNWAMGRSELGLTVDTLWDEWDGSIDDGDISLRDAIAAAAPGETIGFDASLDGGTILLTLGELPITRPLTIDAVTLPAGLTIDAAANDPTPEEDNGDGTRIFQIDDAHAFMDSPVAIRGLTLTGGDVAGEGGAVLARESLSVTDSTVSDNASNRDALHVHGAVTISGSTISENDGIGIVARNVNITSSTISGHHGHGISGDVVTVTGSTISRNIGSGIYGENVTVNSSTISGNSSFIGGGIYARNVSVISSTISDNTAFGVPSKYGGVGGGIAVDDGKLRIIGSIVAGNSANNGGRNLYSDTDVPIVEYSLIGDNAGNNLAEAPVGSPDANGNLIGGPKHGDIDPLLAPLADNGGPTLTHALLPSSPALEAGDPTFSPSPLFDQRGVPFSRVFAGRVDMGAFEFIDGDFNSDEQYTLADIDPLVASIAAGTHLVAYDLNSDGLVNLDDRDTWLAVAGVANLDTHDPYLLGDSTLDGVVDGLDFIDWNDDKFTSTGKWSQGDWNADGSTDGLDFIIWNGNKFQSSGMPVLTALQQPNDADDSARVRFKDLASIPLSDSQPIAPAVINRIDMVFVDFFEHEERGEEERAADDWEIFAEDTFSFGTGGDGRASRCRATFNEKTAS